MKTIHAYFHRQHGNAVSFTPLGGNGLRLRCNAVTTIAIATLLATASVDAAADTPVTTSFTYDAGDQVTSTTDPRGLVTTYTVDGLGQKWQQVSPDSGTTIFNYDAYGRLASLTRPGSNQVSYGYDGLGRVTSVTAGGATQTFTYDSCTQGVGRLCGTSDATGITTYGYSPEGWLIGRGFSIGSTAYSFGYGYDAFGQRTTVAYPDGNQAIYTYTRGVVSAVQMKINGVVSNVATSITYQPGDANLNQWAAANGITTTFSYDTDGRLTGIVAPGAQSLALSYDSASRVVGISNGIDGAMTQAFGYDAMSRLNSVSATADSEAFAYDANGNRLTQTLNGASANITPSSVSNQITSVAGTTNTSYGYDGRGNLTTVGGVSTFTYDAFNRMSTAGGSSYYVDPEGQRLLKTVGGVSTYFAPDPAGPLVAETGASGWIDYIWLNGRVVARVNAGQITTIHTDQTGRPEAMTDASNNVVWRARNFAFDRTVTVTNTVPLNLGFPGQYYDAESGLWNNGFRDYSPSLGRYVESDRIGLTGGINTYAYGGNNPISNIDPLGLDFLGKCLAQQYLDKYGAGAWDKIRRDRDSTKPVILGTGSESMRNAEHYLYTYGNVQRSSYSWGLNLGLTVGYQATKFWVNAADYYGVMHSPWTNSVPTSDELASGLEGANDALFGNAAKSSCGCKGQ